MRQQSVSNTGYMHQNHLTIPVHLQVHLSLKHSATILRADNDNNNDHYDTQRSMLTESLR
jgi:hypothetical protein